MPNSCSCLSEAVPMACVVMEPALAALGRPAPFFMLGCAFGAAGIRVYEKNPDSENFH